MLARISKWFSGDVELDDRRYQEMDVRKFEVAFPGVEGIQGGLAFLKQVAPARGTRSPLLPVTRIIYYSRTPSLHKCDARCQKAKGHNCECACGGKHHGKKR